MAPGKLPVFSLQSAKAGSLAKPKMIGNVLSSSHGPWRFVAPCRHGCLRIRCQAADKPWKKKNARLVLEDGSIWKGSGFGAVGTKVGEVVFNTSLTGYQEIMTDPSYKGQFVCFTHPHIGNVGVNPGEMD